MPVELLNAFWQLHRRGELDLDETGRLWSDFWEGSWISLYDTSNLLEPASRYTFQSSIIIYDALFVALADLLGSFVLTADERLLNTLIDRGSGQLAVSLRDLDSRLEQ